MPLKNIERIFLFSFGAGFLAAIIAFISVFMVRDSTVLGNAGDLVSGVTGFFGVLVGTFAIVMYVRAEDTRTKVAASTWDAKLKLEEAIHIFDRLLKCELGTLKELHGDSQSMARALSSTRVKELYFVGPALQRLNDALERGLTSGLYRALTLPEAQLDQFDLAVELALFTAHVRRDLLDDRMGVGASYFETMPRLYQGLLKVTEAQIMAGLTRTLPHGPK